MINALGAVHVPAALLAAADTIKLQNYKTNTPKRFQVLPLHAEASGQLMADIAHLAKRDASQLDYVYFSACKGAEEHVDALDPKLFEPTTFVVPIILPRGRSVIKADGYSSVLAIGEVYEFNHERPHSLELEDIESGCVVVMVAVKRRGLQRASR